MNGSILVDFSNILYRSFFAEFKAKDLSMDLMRHLAINAVLKWRRQFDRTIYPDMVLCLDGRRNWRTTVFPEYKWRRKNPGPQTQEEIEQGKKIAEVFDTMTKEIVESLPYITVRRDGAEGDDVMAVLAKACSSSGVNSVVVSADKDMKQLLRFPLVEVWDVASKKLRTRPENPEAELLEFIIRGDGGDDVPNFLMPNNTFVDGLRQKPILAKRVKEWVQIGDYKKFCETPDQIRQFERNRSCIDLSFIPSHIEEAILEEHSAQSSVVPRKRMNFYKYLMANQLRQHLENISLF